MTAYRRPKNLPDYLVRSKISANTTEQTHINISKGSHKCNTLNCKTCPYIAKNTQTCTFHNTSYKGKIRNEYTCYTNNVIYLIQCKRCSKSKQPTDVNTSNKQDVLSGNVLESILETSLTINTKNLV